MTALSTALLGDRGRDLHVIAGRYDSTGPRVSTYGKAWYAVCGARGRWANFDLERARRACPRCRAWLERAVAEAFGHLNDADEDVTTDTA